MEPNTERIMQDFCVTAIEYDAQEDKTFDYSAQSIADLEEVLDGYATDLRVDRPTENQIWSVAMIFGYYLGETMLRHGMADKGYRWGLLEGSTVPVLLCNDGRYATPIDKVYKRLVNGSVDNVVSFYRAAMSHSW